MNVSICFHLQDKTSLFHLRKKLLRPRWACDDKERTIGKPDRAYQGGRSGCSSVHGLFEWWFELKYSFFSGFPKK